MPTGEAFLAAICALRSLSENRSGSLEKSKVELCDRYGPTASFGIMVRSCSRRASASACVSATISPQPHRMPIFSGSRPQSHDRLVELGAVLGLALLRRPPREDVVRRCRPKP